MLTALYTVGAAVALWWGVSCRERRTVEELLPKPLCTKSVAVITGGGSGIGLEIAKLLSKQGCHVVLVGRSAKTLDAAMEECSRCGASGVYAIPCDVTCAEDVSRLLKDVGGLCKDQQLSLGFLALNAGQGAIHPFDESAQFLAVARQLMEVNYFANVRLIQSFLPLLRLTNRNSLCPARICVVSSLAGVLPSTLRSAYTASKHAMQGFANALRGELDAKQVTLTLCCPGYVETEFHAKAASVGSSPNSSSHKREGCMSAEECARECIVASCLSKAECIMTSSGKLGYMLRPVLTGLVDRIAVKKSYKSVGLTPPS